MPQCTLTHNNNKGKNEEMKKIFIIQVTGGFVS
jgi:hypothetical protein